MMDLRVLAQVLGNLQQFEALFETEGTETITAPGGERINLFDVKKLYEQRYLLPWEDAMVIEVALYHSANGHDPDNPRVIDILRELCQRTGTEYEEPPIQVFGGSLEFFRDLL
jgi:hypothetical protein